GQAQPGGAPAGRSRCRAPLGARALAGSAAAEHRPRRAGHRRTPRGAKALHARGADRSRPRSRAARRADLGAAGARQTAPAARAVARPADARPLSLGTPRRRARALPADARAVRRGAWDRAWPFTAGAGRLDPPPGEIAGTG